MLPIDKQIEELLPRVIKIWMSKSLLVGEVISGEAGE